MQPGQNVLQSFQLHLRDDANKTSAIVQQLQRYGMRWGGEPRPCQACQGSCTRPSMISATADIDEKQYSCFSIPDPCTLRFNDMKKVPNPVLSEASGLQVNFLNCVIWGLSLRVCVGNPLLMQCCSVPKCVGQKPRTLFAMDRFQLRACLSVC